MRIRFRFRTQLINFDADPYPDFIDEDAEPDADPDLNPGFQNDADSSGSESTTLGLDFLSVNAHCRATDIPIFFNCAGASYAIRGRAATAGAQSGRDAGQAGPGDGWQCQA